MPDLVICGSSVIEPDWEILESGVTTGTRKPVLCLDDFLAKVGAGGTASALPGVWLAPHDDPATLAPFVEQLPIVGIQFPKFADGRGYSSAYLLRQRFAYRGELLAFGDLGRDQLFMLRRVGFSSFALREGADLADSIESFDDFPERYQASYDQPLPLFRRRHFGAAVHA
jgi:uncharacterized protein (DUF934 family)